MSRIKSALRDPSGVQRATFGVNPAAGGSGLTLDYPDGQTPGVTIAAPVGASEGRVAVRDSNGQPVATLPWLSGGGNLLRAIRRRSGERGIPYHADGSVRTESS